MLKGVLVTPAGITIDAGGCAAALFDQTVTVAPPVGAGLLRVTVPVTALPPEVEDELNTIV
jgi:hypothetical protein